jgi:membrane-anchored protein YejM (alkaline phosphatase superfamily)
MTFSELDYRDKVSRLVSWGHWFTFANALIVLAVALGYIFIAEQPQTLPGQLFLLIYWAGHFTFLTFLIFLALLFPLAFILIKPVLMQVVSALLATIGISLLIIDILFFNAYRLHLNLFAFELALSPNGGVIDLNTWQLLGLAGLIFAIQFTIGRWLWTSSTRNKTRRIARITAASLTACFFISHIFYVWADALFYTPITNQRHYFPLSYPTTAKTFLREHGWVDVDRYAQEFQNKKLSAKTLSYGVQNLPDQPPQQTPNILLIVIESWRADMMTSEITPNIDKLAQTGLNFTNHFSGGNNPQHGMFTLLYGIPATYSENINRANLAPLISSAFSTAGYEQSAFTSSRKLGNALSKNIFSEFNKVAQANGSIGNAANDKQMVRAWQDWYKKRNTNQPYFAVIAFSSPSNFATPAGFAAPFQPDFEGVHLFSDTDKIDEVQLTNRYRNSLQFVDSLIPQVLEPLGEDQTLQDTVIILTSDHGMQLNDDGSKHWGYNSNYLSYQTHVPLIYVAPNLAAAKTDKLTSHYDISAQLFSILYGNIGEMSPLTSGLPLLATQTHDWLFMGGTSHFGILETDRLTELELNGRYTIYNRDNKRLRNEVLRVTPMREVLAELRRFYKSTP